MSPELRERLQAQAIASSRSLNQEIVDRLEKSVGRPPLEVPKGLRDIIEAATTGTTSESLEEAAVRLVVHGIQSQAYRHTAEARATAERYRNVAVHQLLVSTNEKFGELLRYLNQVQGLDSERLAAAARHKESVTRQIGQLDLFRSVDY